MSRRREKRRVKGYAHAVGEGRERRFSRPTAYTEYPGNERGGKVTQSASGGGIEVTVAEFLNHKWALPTHAGERRKGGWGSAIAVTPLVRRCITGSERRYGTDEA